MKVVRFYVIAAIVIGISEIIDGALLLLNHGAINNFNLIVAFLELTWFCVSAAFCFVFRGLKVSLLSPVSFTAYILLSWVAGSIGNTGQSVEVTTVPIEFAIIGTLFGIYYVFINERLRQHIARQ